MSALPLDQIIFGDCLEVLAGFPSDCVDLIFADPPYNLQLQKTLWRPNQTRVDAVSDEWDQFEDYAAYDAFTRAWLQACRRVLKPSGTLWVIGSYHNIHRVGTALQDLNFWMLNSVVWVKVNPMPNFRGVRFTNAHETLLWVQKKRSEKYTFNHHAMKSLNGDKQMRSDWLLPVCKSPERIKINGETVHPAQKPEALLYRVISAASNPGDIILDPFFGTGTSGAVAKKLHRHWVGVEQDEKYVKIAKQRIDAVLPRPYDQEVFQTPDPRRQKRIPFGRLLESGLLFPGQTLYYRKAGLQEATVLADGGLMHQGQRGTIHTLAHKIAQAPANGWDMWFFENMDGERYPISRLREIVRQQSLLAE
ncbi:MAG: DNA methyltransferase [Anaerolineae bacterium]|nr:DNA methyltransferase [Anaerolineae bacterium]